MNELAERAVQIARARHPGRPEVARAVSTRFQTGDIPAHVIVGHLVAGPRMADALVSSEVRQEMHLAAFIDRVALALPTVAPAVVPPVDSGLTEREFYPLETLAARWHCTPIDIVHLGWMDAAQVCANIYGMATGILRTRIDTSAPESASDVEPLTYEEQREAEAHNAAFERWKSRTTRDMPHGIFELMREDLRFLEMPNAFPYELHEARKFDGGWWECEFDPPVTIQQGHLCVLRAEVARLDAEVFSALRGGPVAAQTHQDPAKPVQRQAHQEAAILKEIRRLGLDPLAWPVVPNGKANPEKAAVRAALPAWSDAIFDKAWKRLTKSKQIRPR